MLQFWPLNVHPKLICLKTLAPKSLTQKFSHKILAQNYPYDQRDQHSQQDLLDQPDHRVAA